YFFFFQAEDGIRDLIVTGVQTCALPISGVDVADRRTARNLHPDRTRLGVIDSGRRRQIGSIGTTVRVVLGLALLAYGLSGGKIRSEERRVGKEWRSRGWTDHEKKQKSEI